VPGRGYSIRRRFRSRPGTIAPMRNV